MIRHARMNCSFALTLPVLTLPIAMIESSFRALLVPAIGATPLVQPGLLTAGQAAITLAAIKVRTEKKYGATFAQQTNTQPQDRLAMNRHASLQAALDNGEAFVAT